MENTGFLSKPRQEIRMLAGEEEWRIVPFKEVVQSLQSGVSVNGEDRPAAEGEIGVLKVSSVKEGRFYAEENKAVIMENEIIRARVKPKKGRLMISRANSPELVGLCCYVEKTIDSLFLPDKLWQIKIDPTLAEPLFINNILSSEKYRKQIKDRATGTSNSMKNIAKSAYLSLKLPLPPLAEQRRIIAVLGTWDQGIDTLQRLIAAKQRHKKALMQQLLTGKKRFAEFGEPWQEVRMGKVMKERAETSRPDLKLLSITASDGIVERDTLEKRDTSNQDKTKYKRIAPGDIGYNTMRLWQGVSALSDLEGIVSPAYTIVVPQKQVDGLYMAYLFKLPSMIHIFYRNSQGLVDDTRNCKYNHFARIKINIPQVPEQQKIAAVLQAADRELETLERKLAALQAQKKGLMQKLLTGKVRVPIAKTEVNSN